MAKKRRYFGPGRNHRRLPEANRTHIPHDDRLVLQHEPLPPLEHGGVYEEMGADFTYEELSANTNARGKLTHYDEYSSDKDESGGSAIGWLALIFSIIALFIWPFWMGLASLALSYITYRKGTTTLAVLSAILGLVAISLSIITYFSTL